MVTLYHTTVYLKQQNLRNMTIAIETGIDILKTLKATSLSRTVKHVHLRYMIIND